MRVLVFEFITGGGLIDAPLPRSLLGEGLLMREALLVDLSALRSIHVCILQDERLASPENAACIWTVEQGACLQSLLIAKQNEYEAVWLIAPETDGILFNWSRFFAAQGKKIYGTASATVAICANKYATYELLVGQGISCVETYPWEKTRLTRGQWVLKANQSAGCDEVYVLEQGATLPCLRLESGYIMQPYIEGETVSVSCLCYQGQAFFICCNRQQLQLEHGRFSLLGCWVNTETERRGDYQRLCVQIARALPDLWGYIGIDGIVTAEGDILVLEINPRLTTSYAGIRAAFGLNVAAAVMSLNAHTVLKTPMDNKSVYIAVS